MLKYCPLTAAKGKSPACIHCNVFWAQGVSNLSYWSNKFTDFYMSYVYSERFISYLMDLLNCLSVWIVFLWVPHVSITHAHKNEANTLTQAHIPMASVNNTQLDWRKNKTKQIKSSTLKANVEPVNNYWLHVTFNLLDRLWLCPKSSKCCLWRKQSRAGRHQGISENNTASPLIEFRRQNRCILHFL